MTASRHRTRLYIELSVAEGAAERLQACLAAVPAEAVLLRPAVSGRPDPRALVALVRAAQSKGVAALVAGDPRLAQEAGADGVHLDWSAEIEDAYRAARALLGADKIVGASAGGSRHDAMTLAEAGADYIAFPLDEEASAARIDTIAWWAEIFEVPSVALGLTDPARALDLAQAGADFLGVTIPPGQAPDDAAQRLRAIAQAIKGDPLDDATPGRRDA